MFVITASRKGRVYVSLRTNVGWTPRALPIALFEHEKVQQIVAMHSLGVFVVVSSTRAHIVNAENCEAIYTAVTEPMKPRSFHCAYSTQRTAHIETPEITSATFSYVDAASGDCILHTFTPSEDWDSIGLRAPSGATDGEGCEWSDANVNKRRVKNPGHFTILSNGCVVGMRRKQGPDAGWVPEGAGDKKGLRNRFMSRGNGTNANASTDWEVWTASPSNRIGADEEQPLFKEGEQSSHLLISDIGPKIRVGLMSVAFSFGNVLKLVTVGGPERFGVGQDEMAAHEGLMAIGSRRRKGGAQWKQKSQS